ncbi:unnamed protein product [Mycena citricolor]|uniref:Uncharacterized protein n=1 Tax=Mycena citricolor TaxID=2018698 RepID=A0AAD2HHP8_9AGAR|nr:unnamed protein product [Mycena citricolor]
MDVPALHNSMSTDAVAVAALGQVHAPPVPPPQAGSPQVRPPPTAPGHFFARASEVEVSGGNFLTASRDIHYHTVRIGGGNEAGDRGTLKKRSSVSASTVAGSSSIGKAAHGDIILDPMSNYCESEIYMNQLSRQNRGFPLYDPSPQRNMPAEYKKKGICIGDVGRISPDGFFDFFFNIFLPAEHPVNDNDVPAGFSPLAPYTRKEVSFKTIRPGAFVASPSITKPGDMHDPANEHPFHCVGPTGALLVLPQGSLIEKLENSERIRKYAERNAESWYKYVNGPRGRHLVNGSLYVVTGCEKTQSGVIATFHTTIAGREFPLRFRERVDPKSEPIYGFIGDGTALSSYFIAPLENDKRLCNQTVFIHGFTRLITWARQTGMSRQAEFEFRLAGI